MALPKGTHASRVKANIAKRQELKKKWDRHCKYTAEDEDLPKELSLEVSIDADFAASDAKGENWTRLLDEGVVVDGDGYAYAVIRKGALKRAFDAIPSDFKGYIDKDHVRAIHLGYYGKDDLRLVPLKDGRYAIDVNVQLDHELYAVKDLIREGRHHALSVEMFTNVDEFATAEKVTGDSKQGKWLVPLIDELKIEGFAVCENPKNANSVNDGLLENASVEEGNDMDKEELKKLQAEGDAEAENTEANTADAENAEAGADENAASADEDAVKAPEVASATEEENIACEGEGDGEAEPAAEEGDKVEADAETTNDKLDKLAQAIEQLKADNAEKDKKIAELEAQLTAKAEVKMSAEDRIAELLNLATSAEATAAEGNEDKMTAKDADKATEDDLAAAYKAAFAENN